MGFLYFTKWGLTTKGLKMTALDLSGSHFPRSEKRVEEAPTILSLSLALVLLKNLSLKHTLLTHGPQEYDYWGWHFSCGLNLIGMRLKPKP